jgi:hypothetical protein
MTDQEIRLRCLEIADDIYKRTDPYMPTNRGVEKILRTAANFSSYILYGWPIQYKGLINDR